MSGVRAPAAEQTYIESFGELMNVKVNTLNNEGQTVEMTCYQALLKAADATNALQNRMIAAMEGDVSTLQDRIAKFEKQLDVLQGLGAQTAVLDADFNAILPEFKLSEAFKSAYPVYADQEARMGRHHAEVGKNITALHTAFHSLLNDRGTVSTYLTDSWEALKAKANPQ